MTLSESENIDTTQEAEYKVILEFLVGFFLRLLHKKVIDEATMS